MTRNDYNNLFDTTQDAIDFEHQVLSVGSEFLTEEARKVLAGTTQDPGSCYWEFLAAQIQRDQGCGT